MQKLIRAMFSWEFICIGFIVFITIIILAGCSTFISTTVGDTTYSTGIYLDKEERLDE